MHGCRGVQVSSNLLLPLEPLEMSLQATQRRRAPSVVRTPSLCGLSQYVYIVMPEASLHIHSTVSYSADRSDALAPQHSPPPASPSEFRGRVNLPPSWHDPVLTFSHPSVWAADATHVGALFQGPGPPRTTVNGENGASTETQVQQHSVPLMSPARSVDRCNGCHLLSSFHVEVCKLCIPLGHSDCRYWCHGSRGGGGSGGFAEAGRFLYPESCVRGTPR